MKIELRTELKHVLLPQMIEMLNLLQLPKLELEILVKQELEENPFLETEEEEGEEKTEEREEEEEFKWEDFLQPDIEPYSPVITTGEFRGSVPVSVPDIRNELLLQLHVSTSEKKQLQIGEYIIGSLNNDGYLKLPLEEIAQTLDCEVSDVEEALKLVQSFQPSGIGARDLKECLLIQIFEHKSKNCLEAKIVENNLKELELKKYDYIAKKNGITEKRVKRAISFISSLDPRPLNSYLRGEIRYITPDITIVKKENDFICMLNEPDFPRLRIAKSYKNILSSPKNFSKQEREFVEEKVRKARFLLTGIEHRRMIILEIANLIKDYQREFLEHGTDHIKPMNQKFVAERLGIHESTVSRAIHNKYVQTSHGAFALKYLFGGATKGKFAELSTVSIKSILAKIIEGENKKKPLSDEQIVQRLKKIGFNIARRTVAKYREQLKILPRRLRKK